LKLQSQLTHATTAKLCPPSCLHLLWNFLSSLEEVDKHLPNINSSFEKSFLEVEMDTAIKNVKLKSAPGIDQIDYSISSLPRVS